MIHLLRNRCLLCDLPSRPSNSLLCQFCSKQLPYLPKNCCVQCAIPLSDQEKSSDLTCGNCLRSAPYFDHTYCPFEYAFPIQELITSLKFNQRLLIANLLGSLLADFLIQHITAKPNLIIPVPLHLKKLQNRGFNQALLLANIIGKQLNTPVMTQLIQKTTATASQSSLRYQERQANIANCFRVHSNQTMPAHVTLVDDVMTTGATTNAIAKALTKAGVTQVDVYCCARVL